MSSFSNRALTLYTYSDGGTDGFTESAYARGATVWASFQEFASREITLAGGAKQRVDAVAVLHLGQAVDLAGLVSPVLGVYYRIVGRTEHRATWEQALQLQLVPDGEVVEVDS